MRVLFAAVFALSLSAVTVRAEPVPQLYDVTGVAADDVLNIRIAPSASSGIIGTFAPYARGIEVVATNPAGTWGQVNSGEGAGWVSLRYMAARGVTIDPYNLPQGLRCFGTEPFWSLSFESGALRFERAGTFARALPLWIAQDSGIAGDLRRMLRFAGLDGPGVAFVYPSTCSDGMSDRAYGLSISVMMGPKSALLGGCCSLTR